MPRGLDDKLWRRLNSSRSVRDAEMEVARRVAARAQQITAAEGGSARIAVEAGTRPRGRSRVNVVSDSPQEEYGSERQKKIRALGRASREV